MEKTQLERKVPTRHTRDDEVKALVSSASGGQPILTTNYHYANLIFYA